MESNSLWDNYFPIPNSKNKERINYLLDKKINQLKEETHSSTIISDYTYQNLRSTLDKFYEILDESHLCNFVNLGLNLDWVDKPKLYRCHISEIILFYRSTEKDKHKLPTLDFNLNIKPSFSGIRIELKGLTRLKSGSGNTRISRSLDLMDSGEYIKSLIKENELLWM